MTEAIGEAIAKLLSSILIQKWRGFQYTSQTQH